VLSTCQGRPPLLFIAPRAKLAVAPSLGKTRGHRTLTGSHRTLNSQRPVLRRRPRVTSRLKTTVAANGYLALAPDTAPPDAQQIHTGGVRCSPDSCAESSANSHGHRTQATGRTLSVRCSPDSCAERVAKPPAHRTLSTGLSPVRPVHSAAPDSTPDAKGQRPVPPRRASGECFLLRNTPATSPKFPPAQ
jgi:hypothetical protein